MDVGPADRVMWLVLWSDVLCMELSHTMRFILHRKGRPGMAEEEDLQHTVCVWGGSWVWTVCVWGVCLNVWVDRDLECVLHIVCDVHVTYV